MLLLGSCVFSSASVERNALAVDGPSLKPDSLISYDSVQRSILTVKRKLNESYKAKRIGLDSVSKVFTQSLVQQIFPYWYGTEWDFNGYTAIPKQGKVACGYFVSTTLKHAGVNLNRYKMAQKAAMDGALMLEKRDSLFIRRNSRDSFVAEFNRKHKDGLYMVGLSFHVGYLFKSGNELYFIHSSYMHPVAVVCEKALESVALGQSSVFVVADISHNRRLLEKWLKGEVVPH